MIEYIIPPIWCAIADRVRGGFPDDTLWLDASGETDKPKWVDHVRHAVKFTYGAALVLPFTQTWWHLVVAGITWKFGEQIASDFGGTFRLIAGKDKWLYPLIRVGASWAIVPVVALAYFVQMIGLLMPISVVSCIFSALIAKQIWKSKLLASWLKRIPQKLLQLNSGPAAWQETLRGFINGSLAVLLGWLVIQMER